MEYNFAIIAALVAASVVMFVIYKWRLQNRASRIKGWVNEYLLMRYGALPAQLRINCSDDAFWPVLVGFDTPGSGVRHQLQFACGGPPLTWSLLSENDEQR